MANAFPMLLLLCDRMALVIEDTPVTSEADSDDSDSEDEDINCPTPAVIHIASQAAVLVINKHLDLIWNCDSYIVAIGQLFLIFNILLVPTLRCFFSYVPRSQLYFSLPHRFWLDSTWTPPEIQVASIWS